MDPEGAQSVRGQIDTREEALVAGLRSGDEAAFAELFDRYYSPMLSVARHYVATREAAEDSVQDTFAAIVEGIDRFEGRSSLKTWMFSILIRRASTRGERESRTRPFSSVGRPADEPAVDPSRFLGEDHRWAGFWASPPSQNFPEEHALNTEVRALMQSVISELPPQQALVLSLRDVEDMSSEDVCALLDITEVNQRVLLHRARSRCRNALEHHGDSLIGATR